MDRHGIRYQFEHRILPQVFFEDKAQFIGIILNDKDVLFRGIDEIFTNEEVEFYPFVCSWTPEGAHVNHGNCTFDNHNDFLRCADIFMEREFGLTRKSQISE